MSNVEEAPLEIFEWLDKYDLHDLSEKDRTIVLSYFAMEEYEEMRTAIKLLNKKAAADHVQFQSKSKVMAKFDAEHNRFGKTNGVSFIWKIAAALLPFMLISVTYWFTKSQDLEKQSLVVHDTVYFDKTAQESTIHDTVFIEKVIQKNQSSKSLVTGNNRSGNQMTFQITNEIEVVPFSEKEEVQNTLRNYSLRDDSLFNLFPSVTL